MTREEILKRINEIFQDIFDDEDLQINEETAAKDVEGWDSLAHIRIIVALGKEFQIELSIDEMSQIHNIGDMVELINGKISIK